MRAKVAIIGIGETDYHDDFQSSRARLPGYVAPTLEGLCQTAFERALDDAKLTKADIDGLSVSLTFGGPTPRDIADVLGISPNYCIKNGNIMSEPLPVVCADIVSRKATYVAMIFGMIPRSIARQFGGTTDAEGPGVPSSYYFHHPWGWSSQAAHWALAYSSYQAKYGIGDEDLGLIALQLRKNARRNPSAVMQAPMTLGDYLASRPIVKPLRLFDICMVNDGAVCLIVSREDVARDRPHTPVLVAGWGQSSVRCNHLKALVQEGLRPQFQDAGKQALEMAGLALEEVGHFEGYDAASSHLIAHIEGHGFAEAGSTLELFRAGEFDIGGRLPTNVWGGNLSGSYMQGWAHIAEIVRQLRHAAGDRQIRKLETSMFSLAQTNQVTPLVFMRG